MQGEAAKGRAKIYLWLSSVFLNEPTHQTLKPLLSQETLQTLQRVTAEAKDKISHLSRLSSNLDVDNASKIVKEFQCLFVVPAEQTYIPPYESCFRERTAGRFGNLWGTTTIEVNTLYQRIGFEPKLTDRIIAPDHIGLEFAFMSALCLRESEKSSNESKESIQENHKLQKFFIDHHLNQWLPTLAQTIRSRSPIGLYAPVSSIAEMFVNQDRQFVLGEVK